MIEKAPRKADLIWCGCADRYKDVKRIYGYKIESYWSNIASVESYYKTNMDFLKPEVRHYFFREYPDVCSKVDDLPPRNTTRL